MKTLFDTVEIGGIILKNRLIRAAIGDKTSDGTTNEETLNLYQKLAESGVGAIITGFVSIEDEETDGLSLALYNDSFIEGHKTLTEAVHQFETKIILQLAHTGSFCQPKANRTNPVLGPSEVTHRMAGVLPQEMTIAEIKRIQASFAAAAKRGKQAGYDGVEIHGAHSFLLSQFLTPWYNRRTDDYGGPLENRARILLETFDAVRQAVGEDYPIWLKINGNDFMEYGITLDDCLSVCQTLSQKGVNAIEVSSNWFTVAEKPGIYVLDEAAEIAEAIKTSVILTGGNRDLETMNELLEETSIAAFGLARPFMLEPDIMKRFLREWNDFRAEILP